MVFSITQPKIGDDQNQLGFFFSTNSPLKSQEEGLVHVPFSGILNITKTSICCRLYPQYLGDVKNQDIYPLVI